MRIARAYIEITNLCNLNCRSCYNRSRLSRERRELSLDAFSRIAERLVGEFSCRHISLSGGEPTLHRDFEGLLTKLLSLGVEATVVTNGTTDCPALLEAYRTTPLLIQVSLDGSCEEVNAETRGVGSFAKTRAFLAALGSEKPPLLKMVVSQKNLADVPAFLSFGQSIGARPEVDFITPQGNAVDGWDSLGLEAKQKLSVLRTVNAFNEAHGARVSLPLCTSSCPLAKQDLEMSVLISPNGDVYPCQMLYRESYRLGNLLTDSMEALDEAFGGIARIAARRLFADFGCGRCLAREVCQRGCMAFAEMRTGDPLGDDGECLYRKLQLVGFDMFRQGGEI